MGRKDTLCSVISLQPSRSLDYITVCSRETNDLSKFIFFFYTEQLFFMKTLCITYVDIFINTGIHWRYTVVVFRYVKSHIYVPVPTDI
jgi:hypothetical protein